MARATAGFGLMITILLRRAGLLGALGVGSGRRLEGVDCSAGRRVPGRRPWLFTKTATRLYTSVQFEKADVLVFGAESFGLPPTMLESYADRTLRIPIRPEVRSLNLSNSVAIAAYEALRQWESCS